MCIDLIMEPVLLNVMKNLDKVLNHGWKHLIKEVDVNGGRG